MMGGPRQNLQQWSPHHCTYATSLRCARVKNLQRLFYLLSPKTQVARGGLSLCYPRFDRLQAVTTTQILKG
eukprot:4750001-Amphidinium_carterae.2